MRRLLVPVLCAAAAVLPSGPALAQTETSFTATATFTQIVPGTSWFADGVLQVREQTSYATISGDISGTRVGLFNRAGDRVWGTFVLTTETTTWQASFHGTIESDCTVASFVGRGSDGTIIRGTFECTAVPGVQQIAGVILNPTG